MMRVRTYTENIPVYKYSKRTKTETFDHFDKVVKVVMSPDQYTRLVIYLCLSALCLLAAALINWYKNRELQAHISASGLKQA